MTEKVDSEESYAEYQRRMIAEQTATITPIPEVRVPADIAADTLAARYPKDDLLALHDKTVAALGTALTQDLLVAR